MRRPSLVVSKSYSPTRLTRRTRLPLILIFMCGFHSGTPASTSPFLPSLCGDAPVVRGLVQGLINRSTVEITASLGNPDPTFTTIFGVKHSFWTSTNMIGGKRLPKGIVHISVISETGRDGKPLELVIIFERAYADYGIALPHINVQLEGVVASAKEEQGVRSLLIQNVQGEARGAQRLVFYPEGNPNLSIHKPISQWDSSPSYYEPFKRYPTLHILR